MRKAVLLLQMGGPDDLNSVKDFLYRLFSDKYIVQLPAPINLFQKQFAWLISNLRAKKVSQLYAKIGGGSPIRSETSAQALALEKALQQKYPEHSWTVRFAMRYSEPFLEDILPSLIGLSRNRSELGLRAPKTAVYSGVNEDLRGEGAMGDLVPSLMSVEDLIVIPLYPQYSIATSGSSLAECRDLLAQLTNVSTSTSEGERNNAEGALPLGKRSLFAKFLSARLASPELAQLTNVSMSTSEGERNNAEGALRIGSRFVSDWHDNRFYIEFLSLSIQEQLDKLENPKSAFILFSAHGLPVKYIQDGDPYEKQIQNSVALVMENFKDYSSMISYQSKVGPIKWLEPSTESALELIIKEKQVKDIVIVPISFVGDHIETLYEIDILYRELAEKLGVKNFLSARTAKADPLLIKALESLVQ